MNGQDPILYLNELEKFAKTQNEHWLDVAIERLTSLRYQRKSKAMVDPGKLNLNIDSANADSTLQDGEMTVFNRIDTKQKRQIPRNAQTERELHSMGIWSPGEPWPDSAA